MRCGSNTNIFPVALDDPNVMEIPESIRRMSEIGFQSMEANIGDCHVKNYVLMREDWEHQVDLIGEAAAKHGMAFSQMHLPYHRKGWPGLDPFFQNRPGYPELFEEAMRRCYIAGGRLGIPWAVAHCLDPQDTENPEVAAKINHEYYDKYVELGIKHGIGTAFENMVKSPNPNHTRYTSRIEDLINYVDSYRDPLVGINWDFGHANINKIDQPEALRMVGKRLQTTHVDDNFGETDNHYIPFLGTVNWHEIIPVLAEIGYEGDLSLEVGQYTKRPPRAIQEAFARNAYATCKYLVELFEKAKAEK